MNKKTLLGVLALAMFFTSCKDDEKKSDEEKNEKPSYKVAVPKTSYDYDLVNENYPSKTLQETIDCNGDTFSFQIPDVDQKFADPIISLLTKDFTSVTYDSDASLSDIFSIFIDQRQDDLCENTNEGISHIYVDQISETDEFISYGLNYIDDNAEHRIIKTFYKPSGELVKLADIVDKKRYYDVRRILDMNLKQEQVNYTTQIPQSEHRAYMAYFRENPTSIQDDSMDSIPVGIRKGVAGDTLYYLQTYKTSKLPEKFPMLNRDVLVNVRLDEMAYYLELDTLGLDFSRK